MTRWIEGVTPKNRLLKQLAKDITNAGMDSNWILFTPSSIMDIVDIFVIKKIVNNTEFFIEFFNPDYENNHYYMECRFGVGYQPSEFAHTAGQFKAYSGSVRSRFSWFRSFTHTSVKPWLPVKYWLSINSERIVMVLNGDPSANFKDGLTSFGYFGSITPYKNSVIIPENFGINTSSDVSPLEYLTQEELNRYSNFTGTGVTDFCLYKTSTEYPFQTHFVSFTSADEFVNKRLEGPSNYTKGYHFSKVNVGHSYDGYRGLLSGVSVGDSSAVNNYEELAKFNSDGRTDTIHQVFKITAPFSLFNNSDNVLYAISVLKQDVGADYTEEILKIFPTSQKVNAMESCQFRAFIGDMEVTNLDEAVWTVSEPTYDVSKGRVQTKSTALNCEVHVSWQGKTATAYLEVDDAILYIRPNQLKVPIGVENLAYKCYYGLMDVTSQSIFTTDRPDLITLAGNIVTGGIIPGMMKIFATYHPDENTFNATGDLTLVDVNFEISPSVVTSQIDSVYTFKATLDGVDVSDKVTWLISSPFTITKGKTSTLDTMGTYMVTATYSKYGKTASATLQVVDNREFDIIPSLTEVNVGQTVQYQATLGGVDVTDQCTWSIPSPYTINASALATSLTRAGQVLVTAHYERTNKTTTATLKVIDTRTFVVTPNPARVLLGTSYVKFKASLSGVDVSNACTWELSDNTEGYLIDGTGKTTNLVTLGSATVKATHNISARSDTARLDVIATSIDHNFDYYFQLDWDLLPGRDLDLHATVQGNEVFFNDKLYGNMDTNGVQLDQDNTRSSIPSGVTRTTDSMMETISISGFNDIPIAIKVVNYSGDSLNTDANVKLYDKQNNLLRTFVIPKALLYGHVTYNVCTFTAHVDGNFTIS